MIKNKPLAYIIFLFFIGFFLRSYRQTQLLGFFYDQGRDASISNDILTFKNFPAIGPTTGIEGLHLGPFWFYLITPAYFLSRGNPAYAAIIISFIEALTIPFLFILIKKYFHPLPALIAPTLWTFSYYIIRSSRWFSNPTPIPFFVVLIIFLLCQIYYEKKNKLIPLVVLSLSLSLQLEAASAVFFIPVILFLLIINFKKIKKFITKRDILLSLLVFFATLLPQIAFEIKNKFPTTITLFKFIMGQKNSQSGQSWAIPTMYFLKNRVFEYYKIFFTKLDTNLTPKSIVFLIFFIISFFYLLKKHRSNFFIQTTISWLFVPLILLLFFVGNYGRLYDYYLTGFFVPFFIIFSIFPNVFKSKYISYLSIIIISILFYFGNLPFIKNYLIAGVDGPTHISLGNQLQAIDYVCNQTKDINYNLSIYVPPVIPYSYNYLLEQKYKSKHCQKPSNDNQNTTYLLYEVDLSNPQNLDKWLDQFKNYKLLSQQKFGGITVKELHYDQTK